MGRQGRKGSLVSKRVYGGKGKVFKNYLNLVGMFLQHLLEQRLELRTVRSLIVAKDGDDNRCVLWTVIRQSRVGESMDDFKLNDPHLVA